MGCIEFSFDSETIEVTAEQGPFRGSVRIEDQGEHFLPRNELRNFLGLLKLFPLPKVEISFRGGDIVKLELSQVNALGHVRLRVKLTNHASGNCAEIVLRLDYEHVARLEREMRELLLDGKVGRFRLETEYESLGPDAKDVD